MYDSMLCSPVCRCVFHFIRIFAQTAQTYLCFRTANEDPDYEQRAYGFLGHEQPRKSSFYQVPNQDRSREDLMGKSEIGENVGPDSIYSCYLDGDQHSVDTERFQSPD